MLWIYRSQYIIISCICRQMVISHPMFIIKIISITCLQRTGFLIRVFMSLCGMPLCLRCRYQPLQIKEIPCQKYIFFNLLNRKQTTPLKPQSVYLSLDLHKWHYKICGFNDLFGFKIIKFMSNATKWLEK